jgi:hypothetical protein
MGATRRFLQRAWVDRATGVLLKRQEFWGLTPDHMVQEVRVANLQFDIDLPNWLFDHTQPFPCCFGDAIPFGEINLMIDRDTGVPDGLAPTLPEVPIPIPPDFDPSLSELEFRWDQPVQPGTNQAIYQPATIFADGYPIGAAPLGDPFSLRCRRSPDGSKIAFTTGIIRPNSAGLPLFWLDLHNMAPVRALTEQIYPFEWAFSSTGEELAIYGCNYRFECRLYIVNLSTGEAQAIARLGNADSLVWDPGDASLSLLGVKEGDTWQAMRVDSFSGAILYQGAAFPISVGLAAAGIPFPHFADLRGWYQYQPCTGRGFPER